MKTKQTQKLLKVLNSDPCCDGPLISNAAGNIISYSTAGLFASGIGIAKYETTLNNSQLLLASSAPTILIPAPGAGKMLGLVFGVIKKNFTAGYTGTITASRFVVNYRVGGFNAQASNIISRVPFMNAGQEIITLGPPTLVDNLAWADYTKEASASLFSYENSAIEFTFINGTDLTGGHVDNTLKFILYCLTIDL